ncbi:YcnI family protein [Aureimonas fodinaquatilis]|uniref:YcnI family protein n=1 Tax=Aureimonas fodinaquatilis TaxID=2565783 RepID=A0A5B0E2L2_9HYPH|nr:YcnI family protein [Aureimonas fodinaquatilis]KAA0972191.1 YcnI family protein [Aureimonas fodinaquatilis]
MKKFNLILSTVALVSFGTLQASAHITLEQQEAAVASGYKAVFRVGHGCEGKPTNTVRVQIPEGVISVKPQPKAGWTVEKQRGEYERAYDYYGTPMTEGVKEVIWGGGSLADDEYDEFVLRAYLTDSLEPGTTLYFKVVQECPDGAAERWIELPADGQDPHELESPAPGVMLLPAKS